MKLVTTGAGELCRTRVEPARGHGRAALTMWLVPDLALTFAFTTLLTTFFIYGGATALFHDSDSGWHIRTGEWIILTRSLPRVDLFSFSKPGQPWIAWEWGADVLAGAVYRIAGLAGVALLYGLAIGASVWMWFRLNRAAGGNSLLACLFFVPMLPASKLHWLARPHIFSWLFLLGTVWFCERMPTRPKLRHLALVAILAAMWANMHASFFMGPPIALLYSAGAWLKPRIWKDRVSVVSEHGDSRERSYVLFALAASAGTFANPYGWWLHRHVFAYLFDSGLLDRITEFQAFSFHESGTLQILLVLTMCFAGAFAALAAHKPERFLVSMLFTVLALRSQRAIPLAALLVLPLACGSITDVLSGTDGLTPAFRRRLDEVLGYGDRLHAIERRFRGFALAPLLAVLIFASIRTRAGFSAAEFPVAASSMIASLPRSARILAPDIFGGYLIYRFKGERKVFADGRSDFYGDRFFDGYSRLVSVAPGWRGEFNRWNFTHALLPPEYPLIPALEASGWRELYRDRTAVLLTGRSLL